VERSVAREKAVVRKAERTNDDDKAKVHDELDGVGPDLGEDEEGQEGQERAGDGNRQQDQHDVAQHVVVSATVTTMSKLSFHDRKEQAGGSKDAYVSTLSSNVLWPVL
jgi:hypothetical protein